MLVILFNIVCFSFDWQNFTHFSIGGVLFSSFLEFDEQQQLAKAFESMVLSSSFVSPFLSVKIHFVSHSCMLSFIKPKFVNFYPFLHWRSVVLVFFFSWIWWKVAISQIFWICGFELTTCLLFPLCEDSFYFPLMYAELY